jgi:hypothetical protein
MWAAMAANRNRQKQDGRKKTRRGQKSWTYRSFFQVPLQGLVLGLASAILRHQLLEDVGPKLINTLKRQRAKERS